MKNFIKNEKITFLPPAARGTLLNKLSLEPRA
jgi:hypothetical protein